jgi:phage-related protein
MISFDSNNLSSAYLVVNRLNKSDSPTRELQVENLAFNDGFVIASDFWRSRTIKIAGMIVADSAAQLATLLDDLKQDLAGINKNLDVDHGDGTRRYKATLAKFEAPEDFYNISYLPYEAEFLCQPFGYATASVNVSSDDITASPKTIDMTVTGNYRPLPTVTITFTTETGASAVSLTNNTTGDTITVTQAFNASDVMIINCEEQKVTVNGVQVDFTGPIPLFAVGANELVLTIPATARNVNVDIDYTPRYL